MTYKAFISYSHRDSEWAQWLHKSLETYRTPKPLIDTNGRDGKIEKRLGVVFRDRDELPTSHDLGTAIVDALKNSEYLIVICSPDAARSRWVNQEIKQFKAIHGEGRVLALVVSGEPNGTDNGNENVECFPEALRYVVERDGRLTDQRTEPIAADARNEGDGKANSKLKLIAGVLGVGFDSLKQREKKRQQQKKITSIIAGAIACALIAGFFIQLRIAQKNANLAFETEVQLDAQREKAQILRRKWVPEGESLPPLFDAVLWNDTTNAKRALADGAEINAQWGSQKLSPLMMAAEVGYTEITRWLIENGANAESHDEMGGLAVHHAAYEGNVEIFDVFAANGIDIDAYGKGVMAGQWRPIDQAAQMGHKNTVEKLIDLGVEIERHSDLPGSWNSALVTAAFFGRANVVQFLLESGAETTIKDSNGRTAADAAAQSGSLETMELFSSHAAESLDGKPQQFLDTQLFSAVTGSMRQFDTKHIDKLLISGADPNYIDPKSKTSTLGLALVFGLTKSQNSDVYYDTIKLLLDNGGDLNQLGMGSVQLQGVLDKGETRLVQLLEQHGARDVEPFVDTMLKEMMTYRDTGFTTKKSVTATNEPQNFKIDETVTDSEYSKREINQTLYDSTKEVLPSWNIEALRDALKAGGDPNYIDKQSGNSTFEKMLINASVVWNNPQYAESIVGTINLLVEYGADAAKLQSSTLQLISGTAQNGDKAVIDCLIKHAIITDPQTNPYFKPIENGGGFKPKNLIPKKLFPQNWKKKSKE